MVDYIVAEVRKNREDWFAEFNYDAERFHRHIQEQQAINIAAGAKYVTPEEMQTRIEASRQRRASEAY